MRNQKAVSMISLVITVILIIIIASISSYYITSTIDDAQYKDRKEELKNVENVVEYAKTQILIDEFMPNDDEFLITNKELEEKFGSILTDEEIEYIEQVNASDVQAPYKFYLMDQERFDAEFGNDFNVSNLRESSEYLVNYMDTTVVSNYGGVLLANKNIIPVGEDEKGEIQIVYTPNGNIEWKKAQETMVNVTTNSVIEVTSLKYLWSKSYTEPSIGEFASNTLTDGQTVSLNGKTGNDWYLWVYVEYNENGRAKTYITKSNPFYIDNTPPTGVLDVEEITM